MDGHRAAARTDVIDPRSPRLGGERSHHLAGEHEGLGLIGELLRRREIRDVRWRAVRGRLTRDETGHGLAHLPGEWEEQERVPEAIHPDDVVSGVAQRARALRRRMAA